MLQKEIPGGNFATNIPKTTSFPSEIYESPYQQNAEMELFEINGRVCPSDIPVVLYGYKENVLVFNFIYGIFPRNVFPLQLKIQPLRNKLEI